MTKPKDVATADLFDEYGNDLESCETQFTQYGGHRMFSGQIATLRCLDDNILLKRALQEPGGGRVLVVDGGASLHSALMGDLMASVAVENGWAGVVINGAVRDSTILSTLGIGIKALGTNPRKSGKDGLGDRNVDLEIGSATFRPGARLVSDDDGIVILPQ